MENKRIGKRKKETALTSKKQTERPSTTAGSVKIINTKNVIINKILHKTGQSSSETSGQFPPTTSAGTLKRLQKKRAGEGLVQQKRKKKN